MESIKLQDLLVFFYGPVKGLGSFCLARGLTHPPTELIYIFPWEQRKNVVNVFNRIYYQRKQTFNQFGLQNKRRRDM